MDESDRFDSKAISNVLEEAAEFQKKYYFNVAMYSVHYTDGITQMGECAVLYRPIPRRLLQGAFRWRQD